MATLWEASKNNDAAAARRLLRAGAEKEAKNEKGYTALMLAAKVGSFEVAKLLVEAGAHKEAKCAMGATALSHAANCGSPEVAKLLLQAGADKEAKCAMGATALFHAANGGSPEVAKLLLQAGADREAKAESGHTALMTAALNGSLEVAKLLIEAGADKEAKTATGHTALMVAAQGRSLDVARLLLQAGADKDAKTASGVTALMVAAQCGSFEVAKLLVQAGADKEAKTATGASAAELALKNNQPTIFAVIDPTAAAELGRRLMDKFQQAKLVYVISTRYRRDQMQLCPHVKDDKVGQPLSCDPFTSAQVKKALERAGPGTFVFDPNGDHAFLMAGQSESANAIWLKIWLWALERARQTGGCCVQVVVKPGLSMMQEAEADMAAEKGVRVVRFDCSDLARVEDQIDQIDQAAYEHDLAQMPRWAELTALAQQAASGKIPKPLSRRELEEEIAKLKEENARPQSMASSFLCCRRRRQRECPP